ncbi:MAG: DUF3015 domain-containing protein [Proteobacteria bacterium]|nr:DUF3015 domain-containing protein [Pseudomonadota bacterium]
MPFPLPSPNSHGIVQIFAATTNGTSASQTFGITSGTSNCGGGGSSPTAEQYIEANRVSLASEISKGNGETVKGLARIMGCAKTEEFQTALQKNYKKIFPSQDIDAGKINTAIHHVIGESPELKNTCKSG